MSSIFAQEDCDAGSNPGDFRWRLIVRTPDDGGNLIEVEDTGFQDATVASGERNGIVTPDIEFRVRNTAGAEFQVETYIAEMDPGNTEDPRLTGNEDWNTHQPDRNEAQMWAAIRAYESDRYTENEDDSGTGLLKFKTWNDVGTDDAYVALYTHTRQPVWPDRTPSTRRTVRTTLRWWSTTSSRPRSGSVARESRPSIVRTTNRAVASIPPTGPDSRPRWSATHRWHDGPVDRALRARRGPRDSGRFPRSVRSRIGSIAPVNRVRGDGSTP